MDVIQDAEFERVPSRKVLSLEAVEAVAVPVENPLPNMEWDGSEFVAAYLLANRYGRKVSADFVFGNRKA